MKKNPSILSSVDILKKQTTIGSLIATGLRDSLHVDACFVCSSVIRLRRDFLDGKLTLVDIKALLAYNNEYVCLKMKGKDVIEVLEFARRNQGVKDDNGFLQNDDGVLVDPETKSITHITNEPIQPDHLYNVGFSYRYITGMGGNDTMKAWASTNTVPPLDTGRQEQALLLQYFTKLLWKKLPPFEKIDSNGDGLLEVEEVIAAYESIFPIDKGNQAEVTAVSMVVKVLMEAMEKDGIASQISKGEYQGLFGGY